MKTDFTEEYKNWIEKLSEDNFNELVLNFAKEYFNSKEVYISNGPYDGGLDLIIYQNGNELKRNIQITVQKRGYEKKLFEDVLKSKENVDKYSYQNRLDFYISQAISPSKKNELVRKADVDFSIDLKIYDAYKLAGIASDYTSISKTIYKFNKTAFPSEKLNIDKNSKVLFDTLTMSQNTTQIKNNFITSFILYHFHENGASSVSEVIESLDKVFYQKFEESFYQSEIGKLKQKGEIVLVEDSKPKKYVLSDVNKEKFLLIEQKTQIQEAELLNEVKNILGKFGIEAETENIVNLIIELYNSNYELDEHEIEKISNGSVQKVNKIFSQIINHLIQKAKVSENEANDIARNLLVSCKKNDYLNKSSISKMFTNLFKSDKLEYYLSNAKRKVYLDTQILIQAICNMYQDIDSGDALYRAVKILMNTLEHASIPISLHTTSDYISEVAGHVQKALRLERFLALDYIKDLGPSKNVFFNFYLELQRNGADFKDFSEFVEDIFEIDNPDYTDRNFIEYVAQRLIERFEFLNIDVESPRMFAEQDYRKYKKEYEIALSYSKHFNKSYEARKHDLNAILHIADNQFDIEEYEFIEPYFITWDTSFHEVRKQFRKFSELSFWYLMPPLKFSDTISVIDMKINSDALNYNIISMVEDNFNLSSESISFIDLLNSFFEDDNTTKWKLGEKFAKLRRKLLDEIEVNDFKRIENNNLPIDELLLLIQNHYQNPRNKNSFSDITSLFTNNSFSDKICEIIEKNIDSYTDEHGLKKSIIKEFDELIEENNKA
jgi:hypothetical protein